MNYEFEEKRCSLCDRLVPNRLMTEHHLVPRSEGGKTEHKTPMCKACHAHIHAIYDNRTLALLFNTIDSLKKDSKINKFIKFIRKQNPQTVFKSDYSKGQRR